MKSEAAAPGTIYVGPMIDSVKQLTVNKLEVSLKAPLKNTESVDFTVTNSVSGTTMKVKSKNISDSDSKKIILTTFTDLQAVPKIKMKRKNNFKTLYGSSSAIPAV